VKTLDAQEARVVAESLPDEPFTFGARCLLMRGLGKAWALGPRSHIVAAILQAPWIPTEPIALGSDPEQIWELLRRIPGWDCVNLAREIAAPVQRILERELRVPTRIYGDVYFLLDRPAIAHDHPAVRLLTENDVELVDRAPPALRLAGYDSTVAALTGGVAAGGIVDGNLVALVSMSVSSELYADIGAHTLESWRNQGLGSAAAYLVAREVQSRGFTPVWSTGEDNFRSQRVAQKVGFREFGRQAYVVVPSLQQTQGYRPEMRE
jgi:RimJ/RimL family protein N-acetyltransferase